MPTASNNVAASQNLDLLKRELIALQTNAAKGDKVSFILWTKEQQKIISDIGMALLSSSKSCRVIVSGPKGSGKTMLLVYIAHLAKKIFKMQGKDVDGNVSISDGRGTSLLLFEKLKRNFKGTGIVVDTAHWIADEKLDKNVLKDIDNIFAISY